MKHVKEIGLIDWLIIAILLVIIVLGLVGIVTK